MKSNRLIFPLIVLTILSTASCKPKPVNPVKESLITTIIFATGADEKEIYISQLTPVRKVTIGEELAYRRDVFEFKKSVDNAKLKHYEGKGMKRNAAKYRRMIARDEGIIESLDSLRDSLGIKLQETAWYEYTFSADIRTADAIYNVRDWHFVITPKNRILTMKPGLKGLRNGLGRLVPGYGDLMDSLKDVSDEKSVPAEKTE